MHLTQHTPPQGDSGQQSPFYHSQNPTFHPVRTTPPLPFGKLVSAKCSLSGREIGMLSRRERGSQTAHSPVHVRPRQTIHKPNASHPKCRWAPAPHRNYVNMIAHIILQHPRRRMTSTELFDKLKNSYSDLFSDKEEDDGKKVSNRCGWKVGALV
jgi:hypothetical protein